MSCPKGYYWDGSKCKKSITIKKKGIYGKGFLSEPRSEQEAKIRKEAKIEGPVTVEKQMAALNAFSHNKGEAHKDLEYAEKIVHQQPGAMGLEAYKKKYYGDHLICGPGEHLVRGFERKNKTFVNPHCIKNPKRR